MLKIIHYNLATYSLLFLIIFFLAAIVFSQVILKGEAVTVPDITGKTVAQARAELSRKDLSVAQGGSEFDDHVERGIILRQDPAPDSRIRVTEVVQVVTSAGSRRVRVPNLENKSLESALTLLQASGLFKGKLTQIHTSRYPAGRVIAQKPAADEAVERNGQVGLLLSQGGREDRYIMPDLIGRSADRVLARLKDLDFKVADIHFRYYAGRSSGYILGQFPLAGYRIQRRNLITLEVSR
ncbi:MAG: PASTA domain-containing protein [Candidatus Aminicenantales bacterium]